ncbi:hypothetical protein, partial [Treponema endosymbiont of Eucomonympha sp.]|uniref:hypothetical protein n=1 Tax=Treponema endosymbiont of Eucomonympha sp. TaxID=1580831 RepID=UPI001EE7382E
MMKLFGATVPPSHGGYLPTKNSKTRKSDRYCIHYADCRHYQRSKASGNTVDFETPSLEEIKTYLKGLEKLPCGIRCCGACL